ncbi:FG-GAP repeat protein [Marinirhabdus gelatinilytica]|uniref:FG-GAP repeat protein n=2 Tax=Marinirhabdus gelatinilytica TaxID=1703343 RepID=A0A370QJF1_9FLAO|nr:FG-GAP repeat protein [Marinirhabdus gelatinilytica]
MNRFYFFLLFVTTATTFAQVGINTTNPQGTLDVTSVDNTGLVLPRVTSVEDVTDGQGNTPVEGTTVFDISRSSTCFYQNGGWVCIGTDGSGNPVLTEVGPPVFDASSTIDYVKASNTDSDDLFGYSVSISDNNETLAVSAATENSGATGINGNQADNSATSSGAVYIFTRSGNIWSQQAYIKASNTEANDLFGFNLTLSGDGNTLAVSALNEDSNAVGINGDETDNSATNSGAVYIFTRSGTVWEQQAYIKASNTDANDQFGRTVSISGDGNTLAVGTFGEDSSAVGINGDETDNSAGQSGAVYIYIRSGNVWAQQAYIKASNTDISDYFGYRVSLSDNGNILGVSASLENSNAVGIDGDQNNNSATNSGAVYIFTRSGTVWEQQTYIKASNTEANDQFGRYLCISGDGNTLLVSAPYEDSNSTGINGNQSDNSSIESGAVYVFTFSGVVWTQQAYIKASNTDSDDLFGWNISSSDNGNRIAIGATNEDSNATGINGNQLDNSSINSGSIYVFSRNENVWTQQAYIKASNTEPNERLESTTVSSNGNLIISGAVYEDSNATGINGDQTNNAASNSGAVYIYTAN